MMQKLAVAPRALSQLVGCESHLDVAGDYRFDPTASHRREDPAPPIGRCG
jgi:hypothetical protein